MGLREQKKAETRKQISTIATLLFVRHGFDNVSVMDIARAANVSKMTVFNYFPRKEDLHFDRNQEPRELFRRTVLGRAPRTTILNALEKLPSELMKAEHPFANWNDATAQYFETVRASPSLLARLRELRDETERDFVEALGEAAGTKEDPIAYVLASAFLAAWRVAYDAAERSRMAGKRKSAIHAAFLGTFAIAFAPVKRAAKGTPYG